MIPAAPTSVADMQKKASGFFFPHNGMVAAPTQQNFDQGDDLLESRSHSVTSINHLKIGRHFIKLYRKAISITLDIRHVS